MKHTTIMSKNCTTRALSITLILGLLLSSLTFSSGFSEIFKANVQAATEISGDWTSYRDLSWYEEYDEKGNEISTYEISTANELAGLARLVNKMGVDFSGKTIILTADIDLGAHYWEPIGIKQFWNSTKNKYLDIFRGTFDAQGHTISNMQIGESTEKPAGYTYAGLFGCVENAKLIGINIDEGSNVYSTMKTGGICGYAEKSEIKNCSNKGNIYSGEHGVFTSYIGGICGGIKNTTIFNCSNIGTITSETPKKTTRIGGICGNIDDDSEDNSKIENCFNAGKIICDGNYIAGEVCGVYKESAMVNTYYECNDKNINQAEGMFALSTDQMKAAEDQKFQESWIEITSDDNTRDAIPLVKSLNYYLEESDEGISWKQKNEVNNGYPYLSYENLNENKENEIDENALSEEIEALKAIMQEVSATLESFKASPIQTVNNGEESVELNALLEANTEFLEKFKTVTEEDKTVIEGDEASSTQDLNESVDLS